MSGTPVDYDPFAASEGTPVENDPFNDKKGSVWEAIKAGAKQAFSPEAITEFGKEIPPAAAARMAAPINMVAGMSRIPANLMRIAGVEEPAQVVSAAEEGAKNLTESAGYKGMRPGLSNLGGEMILGGAALKGASKLAPAIEALPGGASIVKGISESPSAQAILGGMGLGAASSSGSPYDVLEKAGVGGLFGLGGQAAASGLGHIAAPVLKRFNELKDLGYSKAEILKDTTIGQLLGGKMQAFENMLSDLPFSSVAQKMQQGAESLHGALKGKIDPILQRQKAAENILSTSQGQAQTLEQRALQDAKLQTDLAMKARHGSEMEAHKATGADIHVPVLNYVLEPLGAKVTPGLTGHAATLETGKAISNAYDKSLEGISTLRLNKSVQDDLRSLKNTYSDKFLGKDNAELFGHDIERLIEDTSKGKWLTPDNWQNNLSKLSKDAWEMRQKDPRYSQALYELKDKWMDLIEGQVGSELFKSANTAFSRFKIPEKAASYGKSIKAEGLVEPNELINAARSELSTKRLAGGEDAIQKMAVEANKKYLTDKAAIEAKHAAEKLAHERTNTEQTRSFEDKFTGMKSSLAAQKAALQAQAEKAAGTHQAAIESAVGKPGVNDYAGKRLGYALGAGSMLGGGYGLSHFGVDPLTSLAMGSGTIAAARGLYSSPVQNWLKQKAIAPRSPMMQQAGEALRANAPAIGLTTAQERLGSPEQPESTALPVPKAAGGEVKKKTHGPITKEELDMIHRLRESQG